LGSGKNIIVPIIKKTIPYFKNFGTGKNTIGRNNNEKGNR
jgi:hypothetical protein